MKIRLLSFTLAAMLSACATIPLEGRHLKVKGLAAGYIVPAKSVSPDHRYGITILNNGDPDADIDEADEDHPVNEIVELKTGRVLGRIHGEPAMMHMNHASTFIAPHWSKDSGFVVWTVDSKWYPAGITLVKIVDGKIKWQKDLLKDGQAAILARTKRAAPVEYVAWNDPRVSQTYYPDGFGVEVQTGSDRPRLLDYRGDLPESPSEREFTFPLTVHVELAGDLKENFDWNMESKLEGTVDQDGKLTVRSFQMVKKGRPPKS